MGKAYEETKGSLADRLMAALIAGDCAGGDHRGRLAAGIRVCKKDEAPAIGSRCTSIKAMTQSSNCTRNTSNPITMLVVNGAGASTSIRARIGPCRRRRTEHDRQRRVGSIVNASVPIMDSAERNTKCKVRRAKYENVLDIPHFTLPRSTTHVNNLIFRTSYFALRTLYFLPVPFPLAKTRFAKPLLPIDLPCPFRYTRDGE